VPLLRTGKYTVTAIAVPISPALVDMTFSITGGTKRVEAASFVVNTQTTHTVVVTTDPVKHSVAVQMDGVVRTGTIFRDGHVHVAPILHSRAQPNAFLVINGEPTPRPTLCLGLIH
jgi:hypothetical protein